MKDYSAESSILKDLKLLHHGTPILMIIAHDSIRIYPHSLSSWNSMSFMDLTGSILGLKYLTTLPSAETKNFAQFHGISLALPFFWSNRHELTRRYFQTSWQAVPLTSHFSKMGNSAPYLPRAKLSISLESPGS